MKEFKPHSIVVVQQEGYKHYGEIASPRVAAALQDNGIVKPAYYNVLRVPGERATVEEVPERRIEMPSTVRRSFRVHYAAVSSRFARRPHAGFPVDMLRYDFAAPLNFHLVDDQVTGGVTCVLDKGFEEWGADLVIASCTQRVNGAWTADRWDSFMWSVQPLRSVPWRPR